MFIPKKVKDFADKLNEDKLKVEKREKKALNRQQKENIELEQEKEKRKVEIYKNIMIICDWIYNFYISEECRQISRNKFRVLLFIANYWLGKPMDDSCRTTCATIELRKQSYIFYCEYHKGQQSHISSLLDLKHYLDYYTFTDEIIFTKLHPDFIKQWAEEIAIGKAWEYVLRS